MRQGKRIGRWIVPGAGLTLALAAISFLGFAELMGETTEPGEPEVAAAPREPSLPPAQPASPERPAEPVRATRSLPRAAPASASARAPAAPVRSARAPRAAVRPAGALTTASYQGELARCSTLQERIDRVDEWARRLEPDEAARVFEELLGRRLPGNDYEARTLGLKLLAGLGQLPSRRATDVLVARLDPERPRPERLVAIEMLASRPRVGVEELVAIVRDDHDLVVQERARWALDRQGGRR